MSSNVLVAQAGWPVTETDIQRDVKRIMGGQLLVE